MLPTVLFLVPLESPPWVGCTKVVLQFFDFRPTVQELLNIEQFCQCKFNKTKTPIFRAIGVLESALRVKILQRAISSFLERRCRKYWISSNLCHCKFHKNSTKSKLNISHGKPSYLNATYYLPLSPIPPSRQSDNTKDNYDPSLLNIRLRL